MRKLLTCCLCVLASCSSQHAPPRSKPANCGKTAPIASDFHKADPIEGVGLPPEVFVNLESGAISPRGVDASPLTLQFQLVRSGPAELDGLQFDVSDDIYISRYELSNYQLWYLCNVIGPERWTFDDWSKNRMERFAAWGKLGKSSEAAMRAYCEQPDLPALCVNSVELQQLHFNAKHRWLLDLWIPSVGQWVKMASAGRGARQNLDALIQAKAVKWQGWRLKDAAQLDCLVPVRSTLHGGAEIGGFVDVFGGASEM
ncbi:MAG: hypothetical protein KGN78_13850, partial [Actinomycetales bacterium]|nr:hypothetical protein [Actinomycetales bacterium]